MPVQKKAGNLVNAPCITRDKWLGKVIDLELSKRLKFDHTDKWYMPKLGSVQENEIHKILRDFEIQIDHHILARKLDVVLTNKKKPCHLVNFASSVDHRLKI